MRTRCEAGVCMPGSHAPLVLRLVALLEAHDSLLYGHGRTSLMTMLEAMAPPKIRPPLLPLKVVVPAEFPPARTLNVVALVAPLVMT